MLGFEIRIGVRGTARGSDWKGEEKLNNGQKGANGPSLQRTWEQHGESQERGHQPHPKLLKTRGEGESERSRTGQRPLNLGESESRKQQRRSPAENKALVFLAPLWPQSSSHRPLIPGLLSSPQDAKDSARTPRGLLLR